MCCVILWCVFSGCFVFFFKQKTAYEMRISDWSSDVCSSDLRHPGVQALNLVTALVESLNAGVPVVAIVGDTHRLHSWKNMTQEIGRASCRERVCQYV